VERASSRFSSPLHDERTAAVLGVALGIAFVTCFVTGVLSHLVQDPPGWFVWPSRPAGLYRVTQGVHVATGLATIPLLVGKLWVVYPKLFAWPPLPSVSTAVERFALLPLIGGALLLLVTGLGNINIWRPWPFTFRPAHYAAAWITIGALVAHVGAKWAVTRRALRSRPADARGPETSDGLDRRGFLGAVFAASAAITVFTVGQTVEPLRSLALLAPRRPDVGPQGFPVNRTARSVGLTDVDLEAYRLVVEGPGVAQQLSLTYDELLALPQHEATLPISCVEGWSTTQRWRGVRVSDLLERAGARSGAEATVVSLQTNRRQKTSPLNRHHASDPDTLLALHVGGEPLAPDHGFPVRLIGPNRPGVHQTKWVGRLVVT
jgi:DMSO/TMAO reductase YedYZ molybdopterin-dependent catalytic subunit